MLKLLETYVCYIQQLTFYRRNLLFSFSTSHNINVSQLTLYLFFSEYAFKAMCKEAGRCYSCQSLKITEGTGNTFCKKFFYGGERDYPVCGILWRVELVESGLINQVELVIFYLSKKPQYHLYNQALKQRRNSEAITYFSEMHALLTICEMNLERVRSIL